MCETLGEPIVEEDIPVEYGDLHPVIQEILGIYNILRDEYDHFNGRYLGKNFSGILDLLDLLEINKVDRKYYTELIMLIDSIRRDLYKPAETKSAKKPSA